MTHRALAAFLDLVPARPLYASVARHDAVSVRVLEKCGFRLIGEETWSTGADGEAVVGPTLELPANAGE